MILHQLGTDLRHFRGWLVAFWATLAAEAGLGWLGSTGEPSVILRALVHVILVLLGVTLVTRCVQADRLVGSTSGWKTRPIRQADLFWAKSLFFLLGIVGPMLALRSVGWWRLGLPLNQWLPAGAEWLLLVTAGVGSAATLAALTSGWRGLVTAVVGAVGGFILWTAFVEFVRWRYPGLGLRVVWDPHGSLQASALAAALSALALGAVTAWVAQGRFNAGRISVILLAAGMLVFRPLNYLWRIDFLAPSPKPEPSLTVQVLDETDPLDSEPGSQVLWSHFRVRGLDPHQLVAVREFSARHKPVQGLETRFASRIDAFHGGGDAAVLAHLEQAEAMRAIQSFYPAQTLWFGSWHARRDERLPYQGELPREEVGQRREGRFEGALWLELFEVRRVADLALEPGAHQLFPGASLEVGRIRIGDASALVELTERLARVRFSRETLFRGPWISYRGAGPFVYVLHHPPSGECYTVHPGFGSHSGVDTESALNERIRQVTVAFPYPALRTRLTGVAVEDWLREARLRVYQARHLGSCRCDFKREAYVLNLERGDRAPESRSDRKAIRAVALPARPTGAQVEDYLDTVLEGLPDRVAQNDLAWVRDKLLAIGADGLPALLRRLPLEVWNADAFLRPVLKQLFGREHLPGLRDALRRDTRLVWLFQEKGWEPEAREVLLTLLPERRVPLPAAALRLVAEAKDPATYADLAWHFIHLESEHDLVLPALKQCPGFDLATPVRQAWKRVRLGLASLSGLLLAAAAEGLSEAWDQAVLRLEEPLDKTLRDQWLAQLGGLLETAPPGPLTAEWLLARLGRFQFNPATQRYQVAP